ncbi:MAG: hypothetical protein ABI353_18475 [Isosphaeraceae bacterium]
MHGREAYLDVCYGGADAPLQLYDTIGSGIDNGGKIVFEQFLYQIYSNLSSRGKRPGLAGNNFIR